MTTEDGSPPGGATREETTLGEREVTTFPDRGTILVRSAGPPRVPAARCVDVRPGPFATFDGDRVRMSLSVRAGDERRRFERSELPAIEDAVVATLRGRGPLAAGDTGSRTAEPGGAERAILRFGDLAACRRMLPPAAVDAIERRLGAAASRASSAFVTWTTGDLRSDDGRDYDVVLDPPVRSE